MRKENEAKEQILSFGALFFDGMRKHIFVNIKRIYDEL